MMTRRLTTVAVLLAAVLTMGVGIAEAQTQTVKFHRVAPKGDSVMDFSFVGSGRTRQACVDADNPFGVQWR
jgi:hypothetical protein